jgi:hypothetical protein
MLFAFFEVELCTLIILFILENWLLLSVTCWIKNNTMCNRGLSTLYFLLFVLQCNSTTPKVEHLPMFTKVESMFTVHEILCLSLQVVIQIIFVDILDFMQLPCTIFL